MRCCGALQVGDALLLDRGLVPHTWFLWLSVALMIAFNIGFCLLTWLLSAWLNRAPPRLCCFL